MDRRDAAPARGLPGDGVRHVHGDPGHPDRLRLAGRDPGRPVGKRRRDLVGADVLPDRRSRDDPALGLPRAGAVDAHPFHDRRRRLHGRERALRHRHHHRSDDRLPRHPGLHRRRHDPERVRGRLLDLPALETRHRLASDRARRDAGPHHRADRRRLSQQRLHLALAVSRQRRPRHRRHHRRVPARRLRQAELFAAEALRFRGARRHGAVPRLARVRARGGTALRLARRPHHRDIRGPDRCRRRNLLLASADGGTADRRAARLQGSQLRLWLGVQLRHGHRPLRPDLSLSRVSQPGAWLRRADDRRDDVRHRRRHVPDRADQRTPVAGHGPAHG